MWFQDRPRARATSTASRKRASSAPRRLGSLGYRSKVSKVVGLDGRRVELAH